MNTCSVHYTVLLYLLRLTYDMLYTPCPFLYLSVRAYDLLLFLLSFLFLAYLLVLLVPTAKKLHGSIPLFRLLYCMVSIVLLVSLWVLRTCISFHIPRVHTNPFSFHVLYLFRICLQAQLNLYLRITTFLPKCLSNTVAAVPWCRLSFSPTYHSNQSYFTWKLPVIFGMYGVSLCSVYSRENIILCKSIFDAVFRWSVHITFIV